LQRVHGLKTGLPPRCDLEKERQLHSTLRGFVFSGLVKSAHDCSDGGLAVCLAESCVSQQIARDTPCLIGAQIDLTAFAGVRPDALLFGETQSRAVISVAPNDAIKVLERARIMELGAVKLGVVGGPDLSIKTAAAEFRRPVSELHGLWWNAIANAMQ
jgi:phosphoribosylformylglycinamidine synthase